MKKNILFIIKTRVKYVEYSNVTNKVTIASASVHNGVRVQV
jgi:hypothetical protein